MTSLSPHCEHILGEIPSVHEVSASILRLEHGAVGRNMIAGTSSMATVRS